MKRKDLPRLSKGAMVRLRYWPLYVVTKDGLHIDTNVIADLYDEWDALKIIDLPNISSKSKGLMVLNEFFIPTMLLHEFACRCAEYMLSLFDKPDHLCEEAIRVKRRWVNGNATNKEMVVVRKDLIRAFSEAYGGQYNFQEQKFQEQKDAWFCALATTECEAERSAVSASAKVAERDTTHQEPEIAILRELIDEWEE